MKLAKIKFLAAGVAMSVASSAMVQVEVYAERFKAQGQYVKVTEAQLTYVAIDKNGRPRPLGSSEDD